VLESIGKTPAGEIGKQVFINFNAAKGSAGGNSSCNAFGGDYVVTGNSLAFKSIISTMRACIEDNRMSTERSFLDGLQATDRYEIKDGMLNLYKGDTLLLALRGEKK
jgi:heat shock protein HslJ